MTSLTEFRARADRVLGELRAACICARAGMLPLNSVAELRAARAAVRDFGGLGGTITLAAARFGDRAALIDDTGTLSFRELEERSNAVAHAWRERGIRAGDSVAVLARNHRGFFDAFFAAQKVGARTVLLNTDFSGPQLADVAAREGTRLIAFDEEFADRVAEVEAEAGAFCSWGQAEGAVSVNDLIAAYPRGPVPPPTRHGALVILTSGTTGTPKGAVRSAVSSLSTPASLLDALPARGGQVIVIAPPVFHSMGFGGSLLFFSLGATVALHRRFDAAGVCDLIDRHDAAGLFTVPIMLTRLLDAHRDGDSDLSSLRFVLVAGSQLGAPTATRALRELGEVVYNMYGSTEVANATLARPEHLRRRPDCVGPPMLGARVRVIDEHGDPAPAGAIGRIVVGNATPFEGYTGGGDKDRFGGLVATGDVGHFDDDGLLFIDGRDDSMIVSGGENVFPDEVELVVSGHEAVAEAAVLGVPDDEYGQRLRAYVVLEAGKELTADDLRAYVKAHLARYKVPRDVVFLDELPRTPTGKVLKRALEEHPAA
jgi:fatty-acyl-CoA synthase